MSDKFFLWKVFERGQTKKPVTSIYATDKEAAEADAADMFGRIMDVDSDRKEGTNDANLESFRDEVG